MGNHATAGIRPTFNGNGIYFPTRKSKKTISNRAKTDLITAKDKLRRFIKTYSFDNIGYGTFTKEAINIHVVSKLRPKFNRYAKKVGAKSKWNKITTEQKNYTKYKGKVSGVYFSTITINSKSFKTLWEAEPEAFKDELLVTEIALYTFLTQNGVPENDALGWVIDVPKDLKEKFPKITILSDYLDEQRNLWQKIYVETTPEWKEANKYKKSKKKKKRNPNKYDPETKHNFNYTHDLVPYIPSPSPQPNTSDNNINITKPNNNPVSRKRTFNSFINNSLNNNNNDNIIENIIDEDWMPLAKKPKIS